MAVGMENGMHIYLTKWQVACHTTDILMSSRARLDLVLASCRSMIHFSFCHLHFTYFF